MLPPASSELLFAARDYLTGGDFRIERCLSCGLALTRPIPPDLAVYYPPSYYRPVGKNRFPSIVEWAQGLLTAWRARRVEGLRGNKGRVLDIGCGPGLLLQAFQRRGWTVDGTELSEQGAAHARWLGIPVHVGPVSTAAWPDGTFDAITMWHVLEHSSEPAEALAAVSRLLKPGGVFLVGVPNFGSIEARLTKDRWFHLDVPRHLVHFTPATLGNALAHVGLEVRATSFMAPEFDSYSFVQSLLNLVLRQNALYDLLRGQRSKHLSGSDLFQALVSALLAAPLGLLSVPATLLLTAARQGSSMTCVAVKRP